MRLPQVCAVHLIAVIGISLQTLWTVAVMFFNGKSYTGVTSILTLTYLNDTHQF